MAWGPQAILQELEDKVNAERQGAKGKGVRKETWDSRPGQAQLGPALASIYSLRTEPTHSWLEEPRKLCSAELAPKCELVSCPLWGPRW